jgi:hypothetical protein
MRWLVCATLAALGCASSYNPGFREDLVRRAAFDFQCPEQGLQLFQLSETNGLITSYGVVGCGRQATYLLNLNNHTWVMNVDRGSPVAPTPRAP